MEVKLLAIFVVLCAFSYASAHKYKSGECPPVEPMGNFEMKKVS